MACPDVADRVDIVELKKIAAYALINNYR